MIKLGLKILMSIEGQRFRVIVMNIRLILNKAMKNHWNTGVVVLRKQGNLSFQFILRYLIKIGFQTLNSQYNCCQVVLRRAINLYHLLVQGKLWNINKSKLCQIHQVIQLIRCNTGQTLLCNL